MFINEIINIGVRHYYIAVVCNGVQEEMDPKERVKLVWYLGAGIIIKGVKAFLCEKMGGEDFFRKKKLGGRRATLYSIPNL